MASPWLRFPADQPGDGDIVWVRIWQNYGPPFQAIYDSTSNTFKDYPGGDLEFPWWIVQRWKPV